MRLYFNYGFYEEPLLIKITSFFTLDGSRWIGGRRDEIQTDLWRWASTDEVIQNNLWDLGQPDNTYHKENCLELFESANWQWNDSQCSDESAYICEKP